MKLEMVLRENLKVHFNIVKTVLLMKPFKRLMCNLNVLVNRKPNGKSQENSLRNQSQRYQITFQYLQMKEKYETQLGL